MNNYFSKIRALASQATEVASQAWEAYDDWLTSHHTRPCRELTEEELEAVGNWTLKEDARLSSVTDTEAAAEEEAYIAACEEVGPNSPDFERVQEEIYERLMSEANDN